jgi:hypothetical protein
VGEAPREGLASRPSAGSSGAALVLRAPLRSSANSTGPFSAAVLSVVLRYAIRASTVGRTRKRASTEAERRRRATAVSIRRQEVS